MKIVSVLTPLFERIIEIPKGYCKTIFLFRYENRTGSRYPLIQKKNIVFEFRNLTNLFLNMARGTGRVPYSHAWHMEEGRQMTVDRYARCTSPISFDAIGIKWRVSKMITMKRT